MSHKHARRCRSHAPRPQLRFRALAAALLALALGSCAPSSTKKPLPPIEPWGDLARPYGDALDAAARDALGPRAPGFSVRYDEIWLEDFYTLDMRQRQARETQARGLRERARTLKRIGGLDSLGLYLEALHAAPVDIPSYEEAGRILLERGAWRRGHAILVQGIRLDPRNGVLWTLLGSAYAQAGNHTKARAAFEFALLQGDREVDRTNVAENLATLYVQESEYARAESLVLASAGAIPEWLGAYASAKQALERSDEDAAYQKLLEAARDPRAQSAVYVDLANLEQRRGNLDAAMDAYREALRLTPHSQAARTGLGVVMWARGDLEEAMVRFARLVRVNPVNYTAQFNFAGVLLDAAAKSQNAHVADSLNAQAIRRFSACIDANYQTPHALTGRAQAHLAQGDYDAALADARRVATFPDHDEPARLLIARVSLTTGDPREAVRQLEPPYETRTLSPVGLAMLGKALLELEQNERAAAVLLRAVENGSPSLSVAMNYAVALSKSSRLEEAESVLRGLIEEHPDDVDLLQNLAAVLQRQGRIVEADRLLMQINRLEGR